MAGPTRVYRAMVAEQGGQPKLGETGRYLVARTAGPIRDVTPDKDGNVHPGTHGVTVAPDAPTNLRNNHLPVALGGTGKDPVFELRLDDLPDGLMYRYEEEDPLHGFIAPSRSMPDVEYKGLIASTQGLWRRHEP